jgi:hypothetical protein
MVSIRKCKLTDNPSYMLKNIRETLGIESSVVYEGICSEAAYERYETEENELNLIRLFFFLERMGISNERFEVMIPDYIYEFYNWYENCMKLTEQRDWEGLKTERSKFDKLELEDKEIQSSYRDYIDYIIARYADKDNEKAHTFIYKALSHTVKDIEAIAKEKKRLSVFEWNIFINLYDLKYEMQPDNNTEITDMLYDLYNYHKGNTEEIIIMCKILPKLGLNILLNERDRLLSAKRVEIEKEILDILIKYYSWVGVPEVLRLLCLDTRTHHDKILYSKQREAFVRTIKKYGFSEEYRIEMFREAYPIYTLFSDNIKAHREKLGLTTEKVSEGICAFETYSRYERGVKYPKRKNLSRLAERLGMEWFLIRGDMEVDDYESLVLATECRRLTATKELDAFRKNIRELKNRVDMEIPRNRLAVGFFELLTKNSSKVTVEELEKLFSITDRTLGDGLFFSRIENDILNFIFSLKGEKSGEIGIKLTKSLIDNEKRKKVTDGRYTSIARKNLACLYNDVRKYDKSYKICIELINEIMDGDNIFLLMNLLSCLIEADEEKGNIEQAKELCHDLFYISELYERYDSEMVRTYYEKHFDKNIRWY